MADGSHCVVSSTLKQPNAMRRSLDSPQLPVACQFNSPSQSLWIPPPPYSPANCRVRLRTATDTAQRDSMVNWTISCSIISCWSHFQPASNPSHCHPLFVFFYLHFAQRDHLWVTSLSQPAPPLPAHPVSLGLHPFSSFVLNPRLVFASEYLFLNFTCFWKKGTDVKCFLKPSPFVVPPAKYVAFSVLIISSLVLFADTLFIPFLVWQLHFWHCPRLYVAGQWSDSPEAQTNILVQTQVQHGVQF